MTYALCGFANFGSLGILIGGMGVIVPERRAVPGDEVDRRGDHRDVHDGGRGGAPGVTLTPAL